MKLTMEEARKMMEKNGGSLYLIGCTGLTALPEGLCVSGDLYLIGCTGLTALPEGLAVGGYLDLRGCTGLTALPEGLAVGGSLYLRGCTGITDPQQERRKVKPMPAVIVEPGRFVYCDGILTHIKKTRQVGGYTLYVGKIPGKNVVSDGTNYAHCDKLRDGIADLLFKSAKDRGVAQYRGMSPDAEVTPEEAITMYRIITGACRQGTDRFVKSLGDLEAKYTIREIADITKGQYNADVFSKFFGMD